MVQGMRHIEDNIPHNVAELMCLKCLNRWIGVYPEDLALKDIECKCGERGYVIKTGQDLPDIPSEKMQNDRRYQNMVKMWGKKLAAEKYREFIGDD